jgi:hypothetical protein
VTRRSLTASDLDFMRTRSANVVDGIRAGNDPDVDEVVRLARFVDTLIVEVDLLVWRATAATMALDGRLSHEEINLQ